MEQYKTCPRCKANKTLEQYARNKQNRDGLQSYCKQCQKAIRDANRESNLRYASWYRKANREQLLAQKRIDGRLYYASNRKSILERQRQNYSIEAAINKAILRRARKSQNQTFKVTKKEIAKLRKMPCAYCHGVGNTIDHVIPISRGGSHGIGNLLPCCRSCNSSKGTKTITEWKKVRGW